MNHWWTEGHAPFVHQRSEHYWAWQWRGGTDRRLLATCSSEWWAPGLRYVEYHA